MTIVPQQYPIHPIYPTDTFFVPLVKKDIKRKRFADVAEVKTITTKALQYIIKE